MRIGAFRTVIAALIMAASALLPATAMASAGSVSVHVNMARILRINSPAATVIVGNPAIADVTIQDPKTLVLTGKSFGQTNLIILDKVGNPIADTLLDVVAQDSGQLTVYEGASRTTLQCNPTCQPAIMLGDDPGYTSKAIAAAGMVESAAK